MQNNQQVKQVIKITPDVETRDEFLWVIKNDNQIVGIAHNQKLAEFMIDSLASSEVKRLKTDNVKVLREDFDGQKVILSTQESGYLYNGPVLQVTEFSFTKVPILYSNNNQYYFIPIPC